MINPADVVAARSLVRGRLDKLRDILRRAIAGLPPDQADKAIVDLFDEIDIANAVHEESHGMRRVIDERSEPPF